MKAHSIGGSPSRSLALQGLVHFRSKNGRTPAKFGRYQRNIVTFTQSCIFVAIYLILHSFSVFILIILNILDESVEVSFYFLLTYFLLLDFVKSVFIPVAVIWRSTSQLPQLFSSAPLSSESIKNNFYVRPPEILPRQLVYRPGPSSGNKHPRYKQ